MILASSFSWDINVAALTAVGVQIILFVVFLVKIDNKAKAAFELAQKVEKRAEDAHIKIDTQIDILSHQFGDTIAAIREKLNIEVSALRREMTEDQKFVRDMFVRRESFYDIVTTLRSDMHQLGEKIDNRFERVEDKIDSRAKHG